MAAWLLYPCRICLSNKVRVVLGFLEHNVPLLVQ